MTFATFSPPRAPIDSADSFTPKLITVWREGYGLAGLRADAIAGLTVAIVALPLSMAIAIGSGAKPEHGLYASIVAGFIISALGGSRFQIGGPAGAFIVLVATTIERFGYQGLLAATIMAGVLLLAIGYLRLGSYIKFIPHPVTVGFTAGIAIIIGAGQLKDFLGLSLAHEPAALVAKIPALFSALPTISWQTLLLGLGSFGVIIGLRRLTPRLPGLLVAVFLASLITWAFGLPVETIGTKFGGVPSSLPAPALPDVSPGLLLELMPSAIAIAILGGFESLLSAVVADGMSGRRHRSNCELVAQGWANIASALFGGLCATGTIARTATNIRAHAHGPVAGILHALFLLLFILFAAPLAYYIPLAVLAAVLLTVAWNMIEFDQFRAILRTSRGESAVLLATFLFTCLRDLTEGLAVGIVLGAILFMHRMAQFVEVTTEVKLLGDATADGEGASAAHEAFPADGVLTFQIAGPFFFGATGTVSAVLSRLGETPRAIVLDLSAVPFADNSGAHILVAFAEKSHRRGAPVFIAGASRAVRRSLLSAGLSRHLVRYAPDVATAHARALKLI
ncbi:MULTISPECIES: SulP family inorganic anion transporter [unclassified Beijerinckia]|uniref:SulP family inorganic anion transporter n=1 Tax=unclassified Beijerinckia TaxID=2638183 RepID=UPI000896DF59|nr:MULTISPECIES: SulP family inorganic anion transporter [unclassified Beijerinckia]MDH7795502.1 SulP family sulfate permease [Beijerinckia sp. GAS462]SEC04242.1 sulfate permease, SulP family [Beijerinckia sp. 28-YEA-48]